MTSRRLAADERAVLRHVLDSFDGPGAAQLRAQCDDVLVVGGIATMLELQTAAAERAITDDGPVPVRAIVVADGSDPIGEIIVWVTAGALSALEYAWYTELPPAGFPSADRITFEQT